MSESQCDWIGDEELQAIRERALRFASSSRAEIIRIRAASDKIVRTRGTPGATAYAEVLLETYLEIESDDIEIKEFLASPFELLIVCSATDVIHTEWLRMHLLAGPCVYLECCSEWKGSPYQAQAIQQRALAFASHGPDLNPRIVDFGEAPHEVIQKFGTPRTETYGHVIMLADYSDKFRQLIIENYKNHPAGFEFAQQRITAGAKHAIICSALNVLYAE